MAPTTDSMKLLEEWWSTDGLKMANMDAKLIGELDRLAAYYDITANECLRQIMALHGHRSASESIDMMVETAMALRSKFRVQTRSPAYQTLKRIRLAQRLSTAEPS